MSSDYPTWLKDVVAWINSGGTMAMYDVAGHGGPGNSAGEGGVDLTAPPGTPVYALATGPLLSAQYFSEHGFSNPGAVIAQRVNVPGYGTQDIYYQHIELLPGFQHCGYSGNDCGGRIIQAGEQIGTVGSAGETEVGFNAGFGGTMYGVNHPDKWRNDPEALIASLMTHSPVAYTGGVPNSDNSGNSGNSGIFGGLQSMITTFLDVLIILVIALVLGYFGFKLLTGLDIGQMTKPAMHSAETLAKVA